MAEYENIIDLNKLGRFHNNLKDKGLPLNDWQANKEYKVGYTVIQDGKLYRCKTEHTSTTTFDDTKWSVVSSSGIPYYTSNISYKVDDQVVYNNKIYKCVIAHTSTSTFDSTKWEELSSGGGISVWQANTEYAVNDVVIDSNLIWQCATAHTSTSSFDESKWICISGGEISNGMEIIPLWEGSLRFNDNTPQQLNDNISNYDFLLFNIGLGSSRSNSITELIDVKDLSSILYYRLFGGHPNYIFHAEIKFSGSTQFYIDDYIEKNGVDAYIYKVQGIRKAKPIVSSGMKYETLWEGEAGDYSGSFNITIPTSEPITKYKKLGLNICVSNGDSNYYRELDVNVIMDIINASSGVYTMNNGYSNNDDFVNILSSSSISQLAINGYKSKITKIIGISEGVQIPTGVQAARVTLWEGTKTVNDSSNVQLLDNISNYDVLEIESCIAWNVDGTSKNAYISSLFEVNTILENPTAYISVNSFISSYFNYSMDVIFPDNIYFKIQDFNKGPSLVTADITKITGIKYIQPDSYSTEEKLIGTWIDGKPLYRKVFENPTDNYNTGLSNFTAHKIYGEFVDTGAGNHIPVPWSVSTLYVGIYINNSGVLTVQSSISNPNVVWVAVEYTKN